MKYKPVKNKFGGYRLIIDKRAIDVWSFGTTWAFKNKYVKGNQLSDLCETTFFDWDAIIFNYSSGEMHFIENYIERINNKVLDINLEPNPNPYAALYKALRFCEIYEASLSHKMALYFYEQIAKLIVQPVSCPYKIKEAGHRNLSLDSLTHIYISLDNYQRKNSKMPFTFYNQRDLPLNVYSN